MEYGNAFSVSNKMLLSIELYLLCIIVVDSNILCTDILMELLETEVPWKTTAKSHVAFNCHTCLG